MEIAIGYLIFAAIISLIIVLAEAGNRELGLLWGFMIAVLATPVVALVCTLMSPVKKGATRQFYPVDYKIKMQEDFEKYQNHCQATEAKIKEDSPEYMYFTKFLTKYPREVFSMVELISIQTKQKRIVTMDYYQKNQEKADSDNYILTGYYV